ncbi:monocarboxylate transporter 12-like [Diadema antillarum]|uniref:monocarboxylate transporter 12-like n=1 Tax=Diadema antillarum TaxID=105358 RepID=UPI003A85A180
MSADSKGTCRPGELRGVHEDRIVRDRKPDGGWGWAVTFGVFIVYVITTGSSWAFGVLYIAFLDAFGESKAITAVPGSLIFMTMVVTNPYAGLLAEKFGNRPVIFAGGVLSSLAIFASSFATDFTTLTIMYGLVGGFGFGLSHLPAVVMLSDYFDERVGTATGLAMSGTGLGTIFMSMVTQMLVNEYGWRGTMLVLSAINFNLCVAAAIMRPVKLLPRKCHRATAAGDDSVAYKPVSTKDTEAISPCVDDAISNGVSKRKNIAVGPFHTDNVSSQNGRTNHTRKCETIIQMRTSDKECSKAIEAQTENNHSRTAQASIKNGTTRGCEASGEQSGWVCRRACQPCISFFDSVYGFSVWKNPMFISFLLGINLAFFGMTIISAHVAKRALEFGMAEFQSSSLVAIIGGSQAIGRAVSGPLVDRCHLNPLRLYQAMTSLCGVCVVISIYLPSYAGQIAFCALAGYTTGACATLQTVMCVSLFGKGQMKYTYPAVILAVGIAMLSSPPIAGLCRDLQGDYKAAFLMAAVACFSSVVAHMPLSCAIKSNKKGSHVTLAKKDHHLPLSEDVDGTAV